ncbi:hypothetical protein [Mycobacterium sp. ENV421]|uniref:hypothetical protein n=1 Tax=Mycobacterium sp. ENV421 TaxID=1213407 RepID=UPI001157B8B7|nr:hypothetical protein [Mycobacterium sp. ENV421]
MPRITRGGLVLGAVVFSSAAVLFLGGHRFWTENRSGTPPSVAAADASLAAPTSAHAVPLPKSAANARAMPLTAQRAREQAIPAAVVLIIAVVSVAVLLKRGRT